MTTPSHTDATAADQFARKVTACLSATEQHLPYVVHERLRAARVQAVAHKKRASFAVQAPVSALHVTHLGVQPNGAILLGQRGPHSDNTPLWLRRFVTALPLIALFGALTFMGIDHDSKVTVDIADLDAALLTSDLPPAAYTDPGFAQYLQSSATDAP